VESGSKSLRGGQQPGHRWVDHTGELELELHGVDEAAVFEQACAALAELLGERSATSAEESVVRRIELSVADRALLLAEWLSELVFLAETEGFVPERTAALELTDQRLKAVVEGRLGEPPHLVKAVTYHGLSFERAGEGWRARVVLDV
jgi:SHS2 domain-containing protein